MKMYNKDSILAHLQTKGLTIQIEDVLPSTNTVLKEDAKNGAPEGKVLFARTQTAGRGRNGHSFFSPKDTGIYFSLLLRPKCSTEQILFITPAAAVAVSTAIEDVFRIPTKIKWVNDVFADRKKVCGILTESGFDENGSVSFVVLGIGVNITKPENDFPASLPNAGALVSTADERQYGLLIARILDNFFRFYEDLNQPVILNEYAKRNLLLGRQISVVGQDIFGTVVGIDEAFHLRIKTESGEIRTLRSGEVQIQTV